MTTNHHTPITTGAPANASTVNDPLGQLDSALTTTNTNLATITSDVAGLTTDLVTTDANVASLTTGLATTNTNVTNLTTGLATTNTNLATVTSDVAGLTTDLATTDATVVTITNALNILKSGFIGMIFASATDTPPAGMLACDGATYQKSAYPDLYDALDLIYQISSTEFKVPDLRGCTIVGAGTGSGLTARTLAQTLTQHGGAETVTLDINQIPSHNHNVSVSNPSMTAQGIIAAAGAQTGSGFGALTDTTSTRWQVASMANKGGDQAHNNMQPFRVLNYWIVATL